jgi:hypothetical protein
VLDLCPFSLATNNLIFMQHLHGIIDLSHTDTDPPMLTPPMPLLIPPSSYLKNKFRCSFEWGAESLGAKVIDHMIFLPPGK